MKLLEIFLHPVRTIYQIQGMQMRIRRAINEKLREVCDKEPFLIKEYTPLVIPKRPYHHPHAYMVEPIDIIRRPIMTFKLFLDIQQHGIWEVVFKKETERQKQYLTFSQAVIREQINQPSGRRATPWLPGILRGP